MSWNNALPFWVYDLEYEHYVANCSCAFEDEWFAGTSKVMPEHVINISRSTFKTHDVGGWNYEGVLCNLQRTQKTDARSFHR